MNTNFSIVNQFNCYQVCYRKSGFVTLCNNMQYTVINIILYQILGKRESQTRQVFDFAGTKFRENSQKSRKLQNLQNLIPLRNSKLNL